MMLFRKTPDGFAIETHCYRAVFAGGPAPVIHVSRENRPLLSLPAASGLASVEDEERLGELRAEEPRVSDAGVMLTLGATSNLWGERSFHWMCSEERIEHHHAAAGECAPGRCFFFSNGAAKEQPGAVSKDAGFALRIHAHRTFSPATNMADEYERALGVPQSLGILPEVETPYAYGVPDRVAMIFAPPPLCLLFGQDDFWTGLGLGTGPGQYQFNALEYSGVVRQGAFLHVNYLGRQTYRDFVSPRVGLHFGYSPWETLEAYVRWLDARGFATAHRFPTPAWHRQPVFCGWGEQCHVAEEQGTAARDESTQANYERWVGALEERGLPFTTVVVDDKWQAAYGTFDVDQKKWPDMRAFVAAQHACGRRVILWIPVYHVEGVPPELCVVSDGKPVFADVSNPAYETFLRGKVRHLVETVGVDGFKVDWVWGITRKPETKTHGPLHGIEWLRRFQFILHDETHRWRPDALVETHSTCPLFRESSDVLRLNDLHMGARNIVRAMHLRARIARICGWDVIDCDASSDSLREWWEYMQAQPEVGTPSLYAVTGARHWTVPGWMWEALAPMWRAYVRELEMGAR